MVLELQLEHQVLVDVVVCGRTVHGVAQERERRQGEVVLERLVEVEAGVGEDDPEFLPAVGVLELAEEVAAQKGLE